MTSPTFPPLYDIITYIPEGDGVERYTEAERVGPYLYAKFGWHWNLPASGVFKVLGSHPLAPYYRACKRKVVPIVTSQNGIQWDGRVMDVEIDWDGKGEEIITVYCISNLFWILTILGWVNPQFPPAVQIGLTGKQDIMFGPPDWVHKWFLARNSIRLNIPVYCKLPLRYDIPELPTLEDLLDIDALLAYVNGVDLIMASSRFTKLGDLYKQSVTSGDIGLSMDLVIPTAEDPGPMVFNTENLATLQSILDITSDNFLDISKFPSLGDLVNTEMPEPGYVYHTHEKRDRKELVWSTAGATIIAYKRKIKHATASRAVVGGQAPSMMNDIVEFAANLAIQAIAGAITAAFGLPGVGAIAVGDLFDDVFFAFQEFVDEELADDLGRDGFREVFADNTAAWTLDGWSTANEKLIEVGGSDGLLVTVQTGPGMPFEFGADTEIIDGVEVDVSSRRYRHGDEITLHDKGTYTDTWISAVEVEDKRDGRKLEHISFGDDSKLKDAWGQIFDRLADVSSLSQAIAVMG